MLQPMLWMFGLVWLRLPATVWSHARLMSPPSRSSMWRLGFHTKTNFNDNSLYCGGLNVQWNQNEGKCGICGDPYNMPHPRENEAGGKYGRGIITRRYLSGQVMKATVDVTTNHRGYFEFRLCPNNNPKKEASQDCLDKHLLKFPGSKDSKYYIADKGNGNITVKLQLPKGLVCSQCVFQWTYTAGNNWGQCGDNESRLGCGPQETFRGCADISILKSTHKFPRRPNQNDINNKRHNNIFSNVGKIDHLEDTSTTFKYPILRQNTEEEKLLQREHRHNPEVVKPTITLFNDKTIDEPNSPNSSSQQASYTWIHRQHLNRPTKNSRKPLVFKFSNKNNSESKLEAYRELQKLRKLFQQREKDIQFLRFYLESEVSVSTPASQFKETEVTFDGMSTPKKDFWYL